MKVVRSKPAVLKRGSYFKVPHANDIPDQWVLEVYRAKSILWSELFSDVCDLAEIQHSGTMTS